MLNNTPALPPIPIHHLPKASRPIVQPALRVLERRPQRRDVLAVPNRAQNVPCAVESVLRSRVVVDIVLANVLERLANILLVDEGLRESIAARLGLRLRGVEAADAWGWFGGASLTDAEGECVAEGCNIQWCSENRERRKKRGDEECDAHFGVGKSGSFCRFWKRPASTLYARTLAHQHLHPGNNRHCFHRPANGPAISI